ncbi:MAG TPA: hypothetical protein PLB25_17525 [Rhodoferax sp.]|nr:hypothetical protein [Rhodoferax sp.]
MGYKRFIGQPENICNDEYRLNVEKSCARLTVCVADLVPARPAKFEICRPITADPAVLRGRPDNDG